MIAAMPGLAFGFSEQFRPGEHERVEQAIAGMRAAGATRLRTSLSPADADAGGEAWVGWLLPKLTRAFDVLICLDLAAAQDAAAFVGDFLGRHGAQVRQLELRPRRDDPLAPIRRAVERARRSDCGVVLTGCADWLDRFGSEGGFRQLAAIGVQAPAGVPSQAPAEWPELDAARTVLHRHGSTAPVWLTSAGYSTWRHDEAVQVAQFRAALGAPAERVYWSDWQDRAADGAADRDCIDPRHAHRGVTDAAGRPKLLRRLLETAAPRRPGDVSLPSRPRVRRHARPVVIVGGAGFIGSNLADALLSEGNEVVVFDSLSRPGTERNLGWLEARHGARMQPLLADLRDRTAVREAVDGAASVFHLAAQVAVTTSLDDPRYDFAINAEGTLNLLEAVRARAPKAPVVFASTNKVYGALADLAVGDFDGRTLPRDDDVRACGLDESRPLDFCTPYGCSKGVADQYVLDYARSFGLRTAVLRMSCIYGPRQFGTEDQGWMAHFLIRALKGEPITIYGDGRQVRDVLHVSDAVRAYRAVLSGIEEVSGRAFNLGGGPANAVSLHLVLAEIEALLGRTLSIVYENWRQGDQPYFVADTRRLHRAAGWRPVVGWREGLRDLAAWLCSDLGIAETDAVQKRRALA